MKYLLILLLALNAHADEMHERYYKVAEFSYATGCLHEAISTCGKFYFTLQKKNCYVDANKLCPAYTKMFANWLRQGEKK